jgi:hypothetical protein
MNPVPNPNPNPNPASNPQKKTKVKKTKKTQPAVHVSSSNTVSGLPKNAWVSNLIAAATGLFIFLLGPYLVNKLNAPATAALVNVVPNGVIMALFVAESEFHQFFTDLLWAPTFNVGLNVITYSLYYYGFLTPFWAIWFEIIVWTSACVLSYIFRDQLQW